jgi:hypothetical protein
MRTRLRASGETLISPGPAEMVSCRRFDRERSVGGGAGRGVPVRQAAERDDGDAAMAIHARSRQQTRFAAGSHRRPRRQTRGSAGLFSDPRSSAQIGGGLPAIVGFAGTWRAADPARDARRPAKWSRRPAGQRGGSAPMIAAMMPAGSGPRARRPQHFEEHRAERVNVGPGIDFAPLGCSGDMWWSCEMAPWLVKGM